METQNLETSGTTEQYEVIKYQLDNGMTVILEENNSAPVVAVNVWVKTGSACEVDGEYGLAHVHEHMLFKGTEKRQVGEISRLIEASGGNINAFTSFDETVYYTVIASRYLDTALDVLADAMQNSTFDPEELSKELEVVVEEIRRGKDSPSRVLSEKMFSTAFTKHPYGRTVIGSEESVRSFTREGITDFYKKWYVPSNMVLVVVGDFDTKEIMPKIEKLYGNFHNNDIAECVIDEEPVQESIRTYVIDENLQEGYFNLAYQIPNAKHEDIPVLTVLSNILGGGESSRLFRSIKEDQGLVNNIYAYAYSGKYAGLFAVGGSLDPEKAKIALPEIVEQISRLKYEPVSDEELDRIKVNIESDAIYTKETMQGQAQKLGFYEIEADDFRYEKEYLDRVSRVTKEDIMLIAQKYLNDQNLTAGFLLPTDNITITKEEVDRIITTASKNVKDQNVGKGEVLIEEDTLAVNEETDTKDQNLKESKDIAKDTMPGDVNKFVLQNGITVLIKKNDSVPLFAARAAFLGGVRYEDESTNGISNYVSRMLTRGTDNRSALEIAEEIESIAGEVDGFSGRNSFGVTVESLSKNFVPAMDIFADVMLNPSFEVEETERARREILADINRQGDNLLRTTVNLFLDTLYTEHPYRLNPLGTSETVSSFDSETLRKFYKKYARPENLVITVVGNVDEQEVLETIKKDFGSMEKANSPSPLIKADTPPNVVREKIDTKEDKQQTHILLGFQGPTLMDDDHYAIEVLNTIMSGMGGRLFLELRDKRSLAYSVTSFYTPGLEPGFLGVYIGTAPEKEEEAVQGIKEQLTLLLEQGVSDAEIERAQNYLVGNFEIGLQENASQAAKITFDELYGIGWEEYNLYPEKIFAVTKEDVIAAAKKYIDLDKYTIAIVKPQD
ncbi:MAG: pitrilysin family protein [Thermodesulfobacteriota bacterium]